MYISECTVYLKVEQVISNKIDVLILSQEEQIAAEFKVRALSCHPDKHPNDEDARKWC